MNKPVQYLLVGFPYSGKTTLAGELSVRFGFAHINLDRLKWDMGYTCVGDDDVPDEAWRKIFSRADSLLKVYLKAGKSVVNEYAWVTRKWRDRARKIAGDMGFVTRVIYIKLPAAEIRKRWLKNSKSQSRFHWPKEELERMLVEFEEPTDDEDVVYYDSHLPIEQWVENNLKQPI